MILKNTYSFLRSLSENNDRDWFANHKEEYLAARANVLDFTSNIISELAKIDPTIPSDLKPESCVMRIYRDVRFSKNKLPYKNNFGVALSSKGKNFNGAGYYIQIQPGKSFIAAGEWMPETERLKAIRQEIDYNGSDLRDIISAPGFKKHFGDLSMEDKLKTSPKGYSADHPDLEYLKLKSFIASCNLKDEDFMKSDSEKSIVDMFGNLYPLMVFLRNAIA